MNRYTIIYKDYLGCKSSRDVLADSKGNALDKFYEEMDSAMLDSFKVIDNGPFN